MKKIEINPTLQDWVDYLNKTYQWADNIRPHGHSSITPAMIERVLRATKHIKFKEQDK